MNEELLVKPFPDCPHTIDSEHVMEWGECRHKWAGRVQVHSVIGKCRLCGTTLHAHTYQLWDGQAGPERIET